MRKDLAPSWSEGLDYVWPPYYDGGEFGELAVYDLEHNPTTFDFVTWGVIVKSLGGKSVRFCNVDKIADWKYDQSVARKRFENILIPACEVLGLEYSIGEKVKGFTCGYHYGHVNKLSQVKGIKKIPMNDSYKGHVTVTIRESIRFKSRDSDRKEWDKLIGHLEKTEKVIVLEDCEDKPLPLVERMKLYSGAKMNLSVSNGPAVLCHLSDAPYLTFKMIPEGEGSELLIKHMKNGNFYNRQFHFKTDKQELVWKPDTFETMIEAYERLSG